MGKMPMGLSSSLDDRDAEIAALQTAFDEYIASSRELEDELDAELSKMQEKLAESSSSNAALVSQFEAINPQLSSLEIALTEAKKKLESERVIRRQAELAQDEAEAKARETEGALEALHSELDSLHEQTAFQEEETEELRMEIEVEKERHKAEVEEMVTRLGETGSSRKWEEPTAVTVSSSAVEKEPLVKDSPPSLNNPIARRLKDNGVDDTVSAMSDDFGNFPSNSDANVDDSEDYIRRLEDELEDVTEQLIEAETSISDFESKLATGQKMKLDVETKLASSEEKIDELQKVVAAAKESEKKNDEKDDEKDDENEIALLIEELSLTQEEVRAAEEDAKDAMENLEKFKGDHKEELGRLQVRLDTVTSESKALHHEVEALRNACNDANNETTQMREESENLLEALNNSKKDQLKTAEELDSLKRAFDEVEENNGEKLSKCLKDLTTDHEKFTQGLTIELIDLKQAAENSEKTPVNCERAFQSEELDKEVAMIKSELETVEQDRNMLMRKVAEYEAGDKVQKNLSSFKCFPIPASQILSLPEIKEFHSESDSESDFYRSHSRSSKRCPHSLRSRGRSSSPTCIQRLECESSKKSVNVEKLFEDGQLLKKQIVMGDVRVTHLEDDISQLHKKLQLSEQQVSDNIIQTEQHISLMEEKSNRDQVEDDDFDCEKVLGSNDHEKIATEFRSTVAKAAMQKEHNAQLLVRILKLQGNIQVCCRVRPLWKDEIKKGMKRVAEPLSETELGCYDSRSKIWKSYVFDKVWGPDSTQSSVFRDVEPMALSVVDGYNSCIFAYGQTGSGKTYTMEGPGQDKKDNGISYRTIQKIINMLHHREQKQKFAIRKQMASTNDNNPSVEDMARDTLPQFTFSMTVGMLEIYNDEIFDLLVEPGKLNRGDKPGKKTNLDIRRNKEGMVEVPDLSRESADSLEEVLKLLKRGNECRATACTDSNQHSSRSHMVLNVQVTSGLEGEPSTSGNLYLVDLAGSERVRKSAVEGQELKEAGHINKSLAALGNVMEALDRKASHVPYRDSKLTYLLQDSLGGNSRTMMVVAVCPSSDSYDESQHALQFATRVRRINLGTAKKNVASKNLTVTVKDLSAKLKLLSKAKERSEEQVQSLKKDHARIQDRLKASSESRKSSNDEARTLLALRKHNSDMLARWQKEKKMRDQTISELDDSQSEVSFRWQLHFSFRLFFPQISKTIYFFLMC